MLVMNKPVLRAAHCSTIAFVTVLYAVVFAALAPSSVASISTEPTNASNLAEAIPGVAQTSNGDGTTVVQLQDGFNTPKSQIHVLHGSWSIVGRAAVDSQSSPPTILNLANLQLLPAVQLFSGATLELSNLTLLLPEFPPTAAWPLNSTSSLLAHVFSVEGGGSATRVVLRDVVVQAASCSELQAFTVNTLCQRTSLGYTTTDLQIVKGVVLYGNGTMPLAAAQTGAAAGISATTTTMTAAASRPPLARLIDTAVTCADGSMPGPPPPWLCSATFVTNATQLRDVGAQMLATTAQTVVLSLAGNILPEGIEWRTLQVRKGQMLVLLGDPSFDTSRRTLIDLAGARMDFASAPYGDQSGPGGYIQVQDVEFVGAAYATVITASVKSFLALWLHPMPVIGAPVRKYQLGGKNGPTSPYLSCIRCTVVVPDQEAAWWHNAAAGLAGHPFRLEVSPEAPNVVAYAAAPVPLAITRLQDHMLADGALAQFEDLTVLPYSVARARGRISSAAAEAAEGLWPLAEGLPAEEAARMDLSRIAVEGNDLMPGKILQSKCLAGTVRLLNETYAEPDVVNIPQEQRTVGPGRSIVVMDIIGPWTMQLNSSRGSCTLTGPPRKQVHRRLSYNIQGRDSLVYIPLGAELTLQSMVLYNLGSMAPPVFHDDVGGSTDNANSTNGEGGTDGSVGVSPDNSGGGDGGIDGPSWGGNVEGGGAGNVSGGDRPSYSPDPPYVPRPPLPPPPYVYAPLPAYLAPMAQLAMPLWYFAFDRLQQHGALTLRNVTLMVPPSELQLLLRMLHMAGRLTGNDDDDESATKDAATAVNGGGGRRHHRRFRSLLTAGRQQEAPRGRGLATGDVSSVSGDDATGGSSITARDATGLPVCTRAALLQYAAESQVDSYTSDTINFAFVRHLGWSGTHVVVTSALPDDAPSVALVEDVALGAELEVACPPEPQPRPSVFPSIPPSSAPPPVPVEPPVALPFIGGVASDTNKGTDDAEPSSRSSQQVTLAVALSVSLTALIVVLALLSWLLYRRRMQQRQRRYAENASRENLTYGPNMSNVQSVQQQGAAAVVWLHGLGDGSQLQSDVDSNRTASRKALAQSGSSAAAGKGGGALLEGQSVGNADNLLKTQDIEQGIGSYLKACQSERLPVVGAAAAGGRKAAGRVRSSAPQVLGLLETLPARSSVRVGHWRQGLAVAINRTAARLHETTDEEAECEVHLGAVIGRGSSGVVYMGLWRGLRVAVKTLVIVDDLLGAEAKRRQRAVLEAAISSSLDHPNVVSTYAYEIKHLEVKPNDGCNTATAAVGSDKASANAAGGIGDEALGRSDVYKLFIIQEFCEAGSLKDALNAGLFVNMKSSEGCALRLAMAWGLDVALGLRHVHSRGILHGDLSASNILLAKHSRDVATVRLPAAGVVDAKDPLEAAACWALGGSGGRPSMVAKVSDFGLSKRMDNDQTHASNHFQGTPLYMAPELLATGHISKAADVFSFGVILLELSLGRAALSFMGEALPQLAEVSSAAGGTTPNGGLTAGSTAAAPSPIHQGSSGIGDAHSSCAALLSAGHPPGLRRLLEACLAQQPQERPELDQVVGELTRILVTMSGGPAVG